MDFVKMIGQTGTQIGMLVARPEEAAIENTRTQAYQEALRNMLKKGPNMVMVVIPNNKSDVYAMVKKLTLVEFPVPTQCMTATVLRKPKGLNSVAQKVAIQMAAKLGGEPWAVKMPNVTGLMIFGKHSGHKTWKRPSVPVRDLQYQKV